MFLDDCLSFAQLGRLVNVGVRIIALGTFGLASMPGTANAVAATDVVLGSGYACALTPTGGVACWGRNTYGVLGDGTNVDRSVPAVVSGLTSGVAAISSGAFHTCALMVGGTVKCWGSNNVGQLGNGTTGYGSNVPVNVSYLTGVVAISASNASTCAVVSSGGVKCWGANNAQSVLGDGTTVNRPFAVDVIGISDAVAVSGNTSHFCVVTRGGGVKCWGDNLYGQLGIGSTVNQGNPSRASAVGVANVIAVNTGARNTCAMAVGGGVKCWGNNYYGQIGNGVFGTSTSAIVTATQVNGLTADVVRLANIGVGYDSCVVMANGGAKCWGRNFYGQLGNGNKINQASPVNVVGLSGLATRISTNDLNTCAVVGTGVQCWGDNSYGQLGIGSKSTTPAPYPVTVL